MPQWLSSVLPLPGAPYPATDRPSLAALDEEVEQVALDLQDLPGESGMTGECVQSGEVLLFEERFHALGGLTRLLLGTRVDAERATMGVELLDVDDTQPRRGQGSGGGEEREVRVVLVIDGVELTPLHQTKQMRELEGDQARVLHQCPQTCREVPDVGDVSEHVVRDDQIGPSVRARRCRYPWSRRGTRTTVRMPRDWATSATFFAGSTPRTGTPRPRSAAGGTRRCSRPR